MNSSDSGAPAPPQPRRALRHALPTLLGALVLVTIAALALPIQAGTQDAGIVFPGVAGNYIQGESFSNGSGDIEVVFFAGSADWDHNRRQTVVARWPKVKSDRSLAVQFHQAGHLRLIARDVSGKTSRFTTPNLNLKDGKGYWFRIRLDADSIDGGSVAHFWVGDSEASTNPADVEWGDSVAQIRRSNSVTLRDPTSSRAKWEIGARAGGTLAPFKGLISYVELWRDGWSVAGNLGERAIHLDMRSSDHYLAHGDTTWEDGESNAWRVMGTKWLYQAGKGKVRRPRATTTTTTTTRAPRSTTTVPGTSSTTTTSKPPEATTTTTTTRAPRGTTTTTTSTTVAPGSTTTTTTTTPPPTTTTAPPTGATHLVIDRDTTYTTKLTLRPGDTIEFRNNARLSFADGGSADWQGTPTSTWSNDGNTQNLVRDIKIFGKGDIRFEHGSQKSTIRFVEVDLQPLADLGHYPLHWHHAMDGSRGTVVEGVVVKNSTNRGVVPHASHGITFKDVIVKNVTLEGFWWDLPCVCDGASNPRFHTANNSNDTVVDHMLIDGVKPPNGENGHTLGAYVLGAGRGNVIRDSVAMNVIGGKNSAGFLWPSQANLNEGGNVWIAEDLRAHHVVDGIFVWQNDPNAHVVKRFSAWAVSGAGVDHGAYTNKYKYVDLDVPSFDVHALGDWSTSGGRIEEVRLRSHTSEGTATFNGTAIGRVILDNEGQIAGVYEFNNTGLTCGDVVVEAMPAGTILRIDGTKCNL